MDVGFIGLGNMGRPMAGHIAAGGHSMIAYDIAGTQARAPVSARCAGSIAQVATAASVVFLSLPTVTAGETVIEEIAASGAGAGTIVVDTSTVGVAAARAAHARLAEQGIEYIDAPVSGMVFRAEQGTLAAMVSGSEAALAEVRAVVSTYASNIYHVGTEPGLGQLMKLVNNYLAIASFVTASEAIAGGLQGGLDIETMLEVINASSGQSFVTSEVFPLYMVPERYESGAAAVTPTKDLALFVEAANEGQWPRALAHAALDVWQAFAERTPQADQSEIYPFVRDGGEK